MYLYKQEFSVSGARLTRTGVIVLVKLVDYEEGVVFPHEYTLTGPKIDRYELLQATESHCELIFGIVPDEDRRLFSVISSAQTTGCKGRFVDADGVGHGLYAIDDAPFISSLTQALSPKTILIADGHHRYETALKFYRDTKNPAHAYVMMSLVSMADPGLVIRAFHRLLKKYPGTEAIDVRASLAAYFTLEDLGAATLELIYEGLKPVSPHEMVYLDAKSGRAFGLSLSGEGKRYIAEQSRGMSSAWNHLDVSKINSIVIGGILRLPLDGKILHDVFDYVNDASNAFKKEQTGPRVTTACSSCGRSISRRSMPSFPAGNGCRKNQPIFSRNAGRGSSSTSWGGREAGARAPGCGGSRPCGGGAFHFFQKSRFSQVVGRTPRVQPLGRRFVRRPGNRIAPTEGPSVEHHAPQRSAMVEKRPFFNYRHRLHAQ